MIRRPPTSTRVRSSAASDVYKRQQETGATMFGFRGQGKGLAVVAILLGLSVPAHAGDERVLYASLGDVTRAPIGWVEFCAENPGECHGGATQPRDIVMS